MARARSKSVTSQPLQEFLLLGGSILLTFGITAYFLPEFFSQFSMYFSEIERMAMIGIGAALLALEQGMDAKIQEQFALLTGALGIVIGTMGLMASFGLFEDVLQLANTYSPLNSVLFLGLGIWGLSAAVLSEEQ